MDLHLLAIAVLPVIVLSVYIYIKDRNEKEPLGMLLKAFFFGALCILPAILMEQFLQMFDPGMPVVSGIYTGYVVAGCSEELCKLLFLALAVWRSRHFNEYFDGIVYATYVSLGFACFENIGYVFGQEEYFAAMTTGTVRALLSVPGHFLFGVAMGYYFALAKFHPDRRAGNLLLAFIVPMLLHGTFDALLMIPQSMGDSAPMSGVLFIVFLWFDIKLWKIGTRRLRKLQALSDQQAAERQDDDPYDGGYGYDGNGGAYDYDDDSDPDDYDYDDSGDTYDEDDYDSDYDDDSPFPHRDRPFDNIDWSH